MLGLGLVALEPTLVVNQAPEAARMGRQMLLGLGPVVKQVFEAARMVQVEPMMPTVAVSLHRLERLDLLRNFQWAGRARPERGGRRWYLGSVEGWREWFRLGRYCSHCQY